jgi:hypothetical protein
LVFAQHAPDSPDFLFLSSCAIPARRLLPGTKVFPLDLIRVWRWGGSGADAFSAGTVLRGGEDRDSGVADPGKRC